MTMNSKRVPDRSDTRPDAADRELSRRALIRAASLGVTAAVCPRLLADGCPLDAHGQLNALAFSQDGRLLISGGYYGPAESAPGTISLWSLPDGAPVKQIRVFTWTGGRAEVTSLAMSPDGRTLACGGDDGSTKLLSLPALTTTSTLQSGAWTVPSLAFSPDGKLLAMATGYQRAVQLWSVPDRSLLKSLDTGTAIAYVVAFSPDGRMFASGHSDYKIRLWSVPDGALLKTLTGHTGWVKAVAVSADGSLLVSAGYDMTLRLWSLPDGKQLNIFFTTSRYPEALAVSPDGRLMACAGRAYDGAKSRQNIEVRSMPSGKLLKQLPWGYLDYSAPFPAVAISPDGELLASGGGYETVGLWHLPECDPLPICPQYPPLS